MSPVRFKKSEDSIQVLDFGQIDGIRLVWPGESFPENLPRRSVKRIITIPLDPYSPDDDAGSWERWVKVIQAIDFATLGDDIGDPIRGLIENILGVVLASSEKK